MAFLRQFGVRLAAMAGVLLVLTFVVDLIQRQLPSDPARVLAGRTASPQALAAARERLGLDEPLIPHYLGYLGRLLGGDLGTSVSTRRPVADDIATYLPATLELVLVAAVMALAGGLLLGVFGARDGIAAGTVRVVTVAGASAASFLVAIVLLLVFYRDLHWFPAGGRGAALLAPGGVTGFLDALWHLVLPAVVLSLSPAVAIGRVLRASLREAMAADYVRSARAKGAGWWATVWRHGLRNAAGPALSMAGLQVSIMFSGSVVVEGLFSWPGLGRYLSGAIAASDLAAITGVVLVLGVAYVLLNFVVDMLQLLIDPRLRETS
ncbi:ABC transporter permease [Kineosporia sp. J2-2]|uniref:ABC transporter permease n=1 Tax=Kineosporia corallincola TaxID=2835133 RepID=A0ABS5TAG5_9ACTN|nr:ABC transporter permease [Kineosporia corallincola]MBT0768047.1 ABC transporter permease [Kineosporia corallincola]